MTASTLFGELTGRDPDGLWTAPGRANLIGEHTDYNQGFVLPFAIDRAATVAAGVRDDGIIRVASSYASDPVAIPLAELDRARDAGLLHDWSGFPLGVAWVLGEHGADLSALPGVDLVIDSDVPVGAGLSSSAAVECSVALALDELWGLGLNRRQLAAVGQRAENEVTGAPTGIMDQSASLLGEPGAAVFLDCRSLQAEIVPLRLDEAGLSILVIDTRVKHEHATGGYSARRESCERAARELGVPSLRDLSIDDLDAARRVLDDETFRRVRHVVTEDQRVLDTVRTLREHGPAAIGELLVASHASMRDDFEISVPELDIAVSTAVDAGAIGARMTGGGFGGAAIALVADGRLDEVALAVRAAFADHRFGAPDIFTVHPSDGARRVA